MKASQLQAVKEEISSRLNSYDTQHRLTEDEKTIANLLIHIDEMNRCSLYNINKTIERASDVLGDRDSYKTLHIKA